MSRSIRPALCLAVLLAFSNTTQAQKINNPSHIPNKFQNKINNIRLKGLTQRHNSKKQVDEEIKEGFDRADFGFSGGDLQIIESNGCNVNIGNSINAGLSGTAERNVIVAGDVINVCK